MEIGHIIPHIEALVFASDKPLTPIDLTELVNNAFGFMDDKITMEQIQTAIEGIVEKYHAEFYPFEMKESGGGWQFLTKKEYHKTVAQLNGEKFLKRLSTAALETLAIIAYKQPITKSDIESIRGVNCDYSIQKLLEKELVVITGRNEELPGKPLIYNTSKTFMDYFGINSPGDLPKLKEIFEESLVNPTIVNENGDAPSPDRQILASERDIDQQLADHRHAAEAKDAADEVSASSIESALIVTETGELLEEADIENNQEPSSVDRQEEELPAEDEVNEDTAAGVDLNDSETIEEGGIDKDVSAEDEADNEEAASSGEQADEEVNSDEEDSSNDDAAGNDEDNPDNEETPHGKRDNEDDAPDDNEDSSAEDHRK